MGFPIHYKLYAITVFPVEANQINRKLLLQYKVQHDVSCFRQPLFQFKMTGLVLTT